jgi:TrwC relaxase/AAA domain
VAVVATIAKGYDLDYVWRNVGSARAADYYIHAVEEGEPPGRWWGPGAEALGFVRGQRVDREPYDLLFGERRGPDGARLGRPPRFAQARERYREVRDQLLAAEPHATSEREAELRIEAAKRARLSPLYMDLTVSFSKSVSVFHASLGENARLARLAGDTAAEAYWAELLDETDRMIYEAVWAGFEYFQREAGYTRTGSHARRVDGRETGQWHEAELAVAHWLQHTSRDGDMQLHVHSQIAHICRTVMDGKWRVPDSLGYQEHVAAVGSVVAQHLEEALTRRFGVRWTPREDGRGFEIAGISSELLRVFSSRRADIDATTQRLAAEFEQRYGRKPSQREIGVLQQEANLLTRKKKEVGAIDWDALREGWAGKLADALGISLASVAPSVWGLGADGATANRASDRLSPADMERAAQKALALAHQERSSFTRADLIKHLGRVLPRTGMQPARAAGLLEELADRVLRCEFEDVASLEAPEAVQVPRDLIRADGRSVFQRHGGTRYATRVQLTMEERLVAQAGATGAPRLSREDSARLFGASVAQLDAALHRHAEAAHAEITQTGLRMDQAAAAHEALTSPRRVVVINAPAGSGKTRTLIDIGRAWARAGVGRVIGIAPSQAARNTQHQAYVQELAAAMDARKERIGEHAVEHAPDWATRALGPVPNEPLSRLAWQRKAASIGAYRELSGFDHPAEPIGPEPVNDDPDRRAAWHEAFGCLGPVDGVDVRGLPDGTLHLMRESYRTETAWAPRYVTAALRQVRMGADDAELQAVRRDALARANRDRGQQDAAAANAALAASYRAMADTYRSRQMILDATERDRREWEAITEQPRRLAISADNELRRRHAGQHLEPLRSAEPPPVTEAERSELALAPDKQLSEKGEWINDLAAQREAFAEKIAERSSLTIPAEDPDREDLGRAFPAFGATERDAILQPPRPVIRPLARVVDRGRERDHALEAAS